MFQSQTLQQCHGSRREQKIQTAGKKEMIFRVRRTQNVLIHAAEECSFQGLFNEHPAFSKHHLVIFFSSPPENQSWPTLTEIWWQNMRGPSLPPCYTQPPLGVWLNAGYDNQPGSFTPACFDPPTSFPRRRGVADLSGVWECAVCLPASPASVWRVHVRGLSSEDGSGQSTATGIKNRGRDYFKCQHNVMSCVRRSNVQTVLSGEQLIDQVQFGLLWPPWSLPRCVSLTPGELCPVRGQTAWLQPCFYFFLAIMSELVMIYWFHFFLLLINSRASSHLIRHLASQRGAVLIAETD